MSEDSIQAEDSVQEEDRRDVERRAASLTRGALPVRVKSGEFSGQTMSLETAGGRVSLRWDQVQFIALGIIEDSVGDQEAARSGLRSMIRKLFFGESTSNQSRARQVRETYLLDVYAAEQPAAYRFDGTNVNYRSFLGDVSYISSQNFQRLTARIVSDAVECRLDASAAAYMTGHREKVRRFPNVYDFELESAQNRERLDEQTPRSRIEVPSNLLEGSQRSDQPPAEE